MTVTLEIEERAELEYRGACFERCGTMTGRLDAALKAQKCEIESGPRRSLRLQQPYHRPESKTKKRVVIR